MEADMEAAVVLGVADSVLSWFGLMREEKHQRSERERRAIKALLIAVNETVLYFRRLDNPHLARTEEERLGFERNIQAEEALSRLWMDASAELREINPDLAKRCFLKGQYWADRDSWSSDDVLNANIKLEEVLKDAKALIGD
jgi:hypothetical protein